MTRVCTSCQIEKPFADFHRAKKGKFGLQSHCKPCAIAASMKRHKARPIEAKRLIKRRHILKKQGLSEELYELIWDLQEGKCAVCARPETGTSGIHRTPCQLAVDHDHASGMVLGLLCSRCNTGIGLFRDDPKLLNAAQEYLFRG